MAAPRLMPFKLGVGGPSGELELSMTRRTTIKDIAGIAKISTTAVSWALNNRPGVSEKTRRRILDLAKKLEYRPNYVAKSLIGKQSKTIGLIIENIADPFYPELALGVEEKASELGYSLIIYNTGGSLIKEKQCLDNLRSRSVDGVVLSTVTIDDPNVRTFIEDGFPLVFVNRFVVDNRLANKTDYVSLDNYACGYQGIEHLYRLGHDRIALITGPMNKSTAFMRTNGAMQAMKDYGLVKDQKLVVDCGFFRKNAFKATKRLLGMKTYPKAFCCQDDNMAIGIREAVLDLNLRIPEDVALMGINDIQVSSLTGIDLTTISQDTYQMGSTGAGILINKIERIGSTLVNQVIMKSELIIRKSCGYYLRGYVR